MMAEIPSLKIKGCKPVECKAKTPCARIPSSGIEPKSNKNVFKKGKSGINLDKLGWDADTSEVTEEASPNSMDRYINSSSPASSRNVLVEDKGKVKDLDEFKIELQSYPSCRVPNLEPSESLPRRKIQLRLTEMRGYRTNFVSSREIGSGKCSLAKDVFNFNNINKKKIAQTNDLCSLQEGMDKRKIFKQARSVSRKISSTKLLHLLMKSSSE